VEQVLHQRRELGGISRLTFQLSLAETALPHEKIMESIGLIGKEVIPVLRSQANI
jgi:hypothetical protein